MKRLPMNGHMRAEHHDTLLSFFGNLFWQSPWNAVLANLLKTLFHSNDEAT